ncbi:MAG: class I adenylate-forming enzyme family protein [Pyrobaculum sp.]
MFYWSKIVPGKVAACDDEMCVTYGELAKLAAEWLYPGRVLFAASSSVRSLAALMGLLNGGGTVALIDPDSTPEDLKFYIDDFAPDVVAGDVEFIQRNREALRDVKTVDISQSLGAGGKPTLRGRFVLYHAGVAGRTMQVIHNVSSLWINAYVLSTTMSLSRDDVVFTASPIVTVPGLVNVAAALSAGASVKFLKKPKPEALDGVTIAVGPPSFYLEMLRMGVRRLRLRYAVSSAAVLQPEVRTEFEVKTGVKILQQYTLAEGLVVSFEPLGYYSRGSIGLPLPLVEVKLMEDGELWIKSPWNMEGYKDEEETRKVLIDGWLRTGDIVHVDEDGLLYFRGAKKRIIKHRGYTIFPRDLEQLLKRHPAVAEANVVGEPHPHYGEVPVAYVKLRESVSPDELLDFVNSKVAPFKRLHKIYITK